MRRLTCSAIVLALLASAAWAHPLGNDSITHFSVLYILPDRFEVDYLLDIAETPASAVRKNEIDANGDDVDTPEEQKAWLDKKAFEYAPFLKASINGKPLELRPLDEAIDPKTGEKGKASRLIIKMPGFAEMPTYRLLIRYGASYPAPLGPGVHRIEYRDDTYPDTPGLRRILLESTPGVTFELPRPAFWDEGIDPFIYDQYDPANLPQEKSATVSFRLPSALTATQLAEVTPAVPEPSPETAPAVADASQEPATTQPASGGSLPPYVESFTDPRNNPAQASKSMQQASRIIELLRGRWGIMVFLTVTALSFVWGAAHALMPGHAKTVVAAYLISQHGTYRHAIALAIIVTITHTALVVIMGLIIWAYQSTHPNLGPTLQLWLGMIAGVLVAIMGVTLVWRAITGRIVHHHHDHDHSHDENRSWWRKLFTHSHPHLPGHHHHHHHDHHHHPDHGHHHHHHAHDHSHAHAHHHNDHAHAHHGHDHHHAHSHAHSHDHGHAHDHHHAHDHAQGHTHSHDHAHGHSHDHGHGHHHHHDHLPYAGGAAPTAEPLSTRMLLMLGITGGIVPCPTAMIIMLLGIGANVVAGALYAVGVFSLGLALTLMVIGFLALSSRRFAARIMSDAQHEGELTGTGQRVMFQYIPAVSGMVVVALGVAIAVNYIYILRTGQALISWLG